jgi:hypothetical protein
MYLDWRIGFLDNAEILPKMHKNIFSVTYMEGKEFT